MKAKYLIVFALSVVIKTGFTAFGVDFGGGGLAISPDNRTVIFSSIKTGRGDLYRLTLGEKKAVNLTSTSSYEGWPSFSPDGERILFSKETTAGKHANLFIADKEFMSVKQLSTGPFYDAASSVSTDGKLVVFARASRLRPYSMGGEVWDDWDLYSVKIDGSQLQQITNQRLRQIDSPRFVGNSKIVFAGRAIASKSVTKVFYVNLDADKKVVPIEPFNTGNYTVGNPNVSSAKSLIAFISNRVSRNAPYDYEIWTMTLDGKNSKQVTHLQSYLRFPIFDSTGLRLFFLSDKERIGEVDLMSCAVDGADTKTIYRNIR